MFSGAKKRDSLSSLPWRLFKRTGLFVVGQIPAVIQMAAGALIFRQIIKANRLQTLNDMDNLRKEVVNVDVKVRERLLKDVSVKIKPLVEDMIRPLLDGYFSNTKAFVSEILTNPTYAELLHVADKEIEITQDLHHVFFEGVHVVKKVTSTLTQIELILCS